MIEWLQGQFVEAWWTRPFLAPETPSPAGRRVVTYPSKSATARATTFVARRRSSSTTCSSARFALLSSTVRGPAP